LRRKGILLAKLAVVVPLVPLLIWAYRSGPPPGVSGAPGEGSCWAAGCHQSPTGALVENSNAIEITFPAGPRYQPGIQQRLRLTITDPQGRGFGFQLSVRDGQNRQAGTLAPADARTQLTTEGGISYLEHTNAFADGIFEFNWTPPATAVGTVTFYVAANAANMNGSSAGDRIHLRRISVEPQAEVRRPQIRATQPVLQAFDNSERMSAGTWIQIFGENLSETTRQWRGDDFTQGRGPTALDGVRVNINGRPAFISYISPTQINAQAPDDDAVGPVNVEVINANGTSNAAVIQKTRISPAMLADARFASGGRSYVVAIYPDFNQTGTFVGPENLVAGARFRPARPGETIIIYAVGCGPTNPPSPAGQVPNASLPLALPFEFRIGGAAAPAQGALVAGFLGLYQFNVTVPEVPDGDARIELTVDGQATGQTLFIAVRR
jgi:uncharacterized protein (TIGR03437 family)